MNTTRATILLAALGAAAMSKAQESAREQAVQRQLDRQVRGEAPPTSPRGEDAVARLVRALDEAALDDQRQRPYQAFQQLRTLGPLAFETVYRLLPELGAFGIKNALQLLAERPDERFVKLLAQMLQSDSFAKQVAAAELMPRVPAEAQKSLAAIARKSTFPLVRAHGVGVAAAGGASAEELRPELEGLLAGGDRYVREALRYVLGAPAFHGETGRRVLEKLLTDRDEDAFAQLSGAWVATLAASDMEHLRALLAKVEPDSRARRALAYGTAHSPSDQPAARMLGQLMADVADENVPQALERLDEARLAISAGALEKLLARRRHVDRLVSHLAKAPLDASHAPALEAATFDTQLPSSPRSSFMMALDRVAPERVLARAKDLLADGTLAANAEYVLARRATPEIVPLLVERVRRLAAIGGQPSPQLLEAIETKSDATNLPALLDLVMESRRLPSQHVDSAYRAIARCLTREQIAPLAGRWWSIPEPAASQMIDLVTRTATTSEAEALAELYFQALRRRQQEAQTDAGEGTLADVTRQWLAKLLRRLDSDPLRRVATAHAADADPQIRASALSLLGALRGVDSKAVAKAALAGEPGIGAIHELASWPEIAEDAELCERLFKALLAAQDGTVKRAQAWAMLLEASPAVTRRKLAAEAVDLHAKGTRHADLVPSALEALGAERNVADVERFRAVLADRTAEVRRAAVRQLARLCDKAAVPALIEALRDEDDDVRGIASQGLQRLEEYLGAQERWKASLGR